MTAQHEESLSRAEVAGSAAGPRSTATPGSTDIVIIGGGPSGSTAGILLAERGYRVVLLEKARHPRFHIGESLLPANLPLLERLGVADQVRAIGLKKPGAEFVSPWHGRSETFMFVDAWNRNQPYAYQVRRSEFDEILIRRAAAVGVTVIEGCRARRVDLGDGTGASRIEATHEDGAQAIWNAKFVLDASGRDTLIANQLGAKRRNERHNSAAMYAHFRGAQRHLGERAGIISIYWFEHGWFWFIPLADGATSIGAVVWPYYMKSRALPLREFFFQTLAQCGPLNERLAGAELVSEVEATGNYSYSTDRSHGRNFLLLGDAYAFIDPVFSSGVWLAMHSAVAGAEAVDSCLRAPKRAAAALRRFDRVMRCGPREFSWFIYRVTNPTMRELFMHPRNPLGAKSALLSMLAGDIFDGTPIWASLAIFKAVYRLSCLFNPRRSLAAMRRRERNIREPPTSVHPTA
jgi:flavin-dependent dehydrogenase